MEPGPGIRKSPYEEGLYFISPEPGTTLQDHSAQWQVGSRYSLLKVLGYGSYSAVVLALDRATGTTVALKRVGDVLQSPDHCKRVLREICILRRLRHPNIIGIHDAFVRPSATGQCRLIRGKLVNLSVDVYIAMELADGGDLFHLRGQVSGDEVKSLMWQLLTTIKYLHSLHVWHRDMKSQNVFLVREGGEQVVKIGDFGSARSAIPEGYQWAEQTAPSLADAMELRNGSRASRLHAADSYQQMNEAMRPEDLYAHPVGGGRGSKPGYKAPLTRVVATPCYRAPEVVMSRGGYTAAIDMWSLGCIFGELLQRIAHVGSATTPNLQVAPLFAIHGLPKTPEDGESFLFGPGNEMTRSELQALFAVIGTPCWADVAAVQEPSWRRYLHHLPGRAPTLYRRFAAAGEAAVDLLSRLLAFDPTRRCSPDEALAHEYFADLAISEPGSYDDLCLPLRHSRRSAGAFNGSEAGGGPEAGLGPALAGRLPSGLMDIAEPPATPISELQPYQVASAPRPVPAPVQPAAGAGSAAQQAVQQPVPSPSSLTGPFASRLRVGSNDSSLDEAGGGDTAMGEAQAAGGAPPAAAEPAAVAAQQQQQQGERSRHYWEESHPGKALSMLEDELQEITTQFNCGSPEDEGSQKMRGMLEAECEAIRAASEAEHQQRGGGGGGGADVAGGSGKKRARVPHPGSADKSSLSSLLKHRTAGLQEDTGAAGLADAERYARERLSNVADTAAGRELDPSRILGAQRHGEWFQQQATRGPAPGPAWGVTLLPPGVDEAGVDSKLLAVMRTQQGR